MSKRVVAVLIIGASVFCAACFIGLIMLVKSAGERRDARRAVEEAREQDREREVGRAEAAAVFADPQAPTPAEGREFVAVLDELGRALQKEDGEAVVQTFDAERMFDEVNRRGTLDRAGVRGGPREREAFVRGFRKAGASIVSNPLFRWQRTDAHHVRWSPGRNEAVVIATHVNDLELIGRTKTKVRWWFVRGADGWRVYDFEELSQGLRVTTIMGTFLTDNVAGRLPEVREAVQALREAMTAIVQRDVEGSEEALTRCRNVELPKPLTAVVCLIEAMLRLYRGEPAAAHEFIDRAALLAPDMPILDYLRATCFLETSDNEKALKAIDSYIAQLGTDEDAEVLRGRALEGLNRFPEAKAAYRRAHDLDPDAAEALGALRRVLAPGELKELGERLARASDPRRVYAEVLLEGEPNEAADDVLLDALRKAKPDDPRGLADDIRRKVKAEKFDEAKALMEHGLKAAAHRDRVEVLNSYLLVMASAKKLLKGYASVPAEHAPTAFRTLAGSFDDEFDPTGETPVDSLGSLKELVAAHRKRMPNDPWIWFYQGVIYEREKQYEKAAEAFATGGSRLPKPKAKDPDAEDEEASDEETFRWRRVECLFKAKKGLEAYEKVEPAAEAFQQLARLYDQSEDFDGLAALLAAHRKRTPNDPQTLYWQGHLSFRKRDYAAATVLFKKFLLDNDEEVQNRWLARSEYVRGVLRTKPADAEKLLSEFGNEIAPALRAAIAAANGNRPELERLLADATKRGGKLWFYSDEDFRNAINQKQWSDLRAKYPDPTPPPKADD